MTFFKRLLGVSAACLLAAAINLPALALTPTPPKDSAKAPVLSTESNREVILKAYAYQPFQQGNINLYINEVRAEMSHAPITSDGGRGYTIKTPLALTDTAVFSVSLAKTVNIQYMDVVRKAALRPNAKYPAYAVRLAENVITTHMPVNFTATYTARKTTTLPVTDADGNSTTITITKGAKLVYDFRLNVNYDYLSRLRFTPDYASARVTLSAESAYGVKGELLYADFDAGADYTWQSAAKMVCAEVNGKLTAAPKLYTSLTDKNLKVALNGKTAFYRRFSTASPIENTVTLTLENPFLTYEGNPVIPEKQVQIYILEDNLLKNITSQFRRTTNSRGRSAFTANVSSLGTYLMVES